ncbi:MAG: hypothetical protein CMM50_08110 [Rhodospirillaceae bacterium]|jgi:hypothetical protein|nr:hypothetical protein [Rhodospirillaceae bacterium]|tara:strand:- start:621 stop:854 length:234 start_codon:yes stop_codon:yes gene_type:complete
MSPRAKSILIVLGFVAALAGASWFGLHVWTTMGDVSISVHGYIALGLGVLITTLLGVGLMALVFYSARRGHDNTYDS